ncbi:MAG: KUP/HAK/KT family potassium transporter [Spirochaetes bacterium]|nr:KUP/HAK/KT family potassium transporter [Spirochaetota bacterium]
MKILYSREDWKEIVKAMGLVFGDIGTSPIYTLSVIALFIKPTEDNIIGVLSLIIWTLIILVSVEYTWLAMKLDDNGQGGTIILQNILAKKLRKARPAVIVSFLAYMGISLLLGDGVITPAISILSAVEGLTLIPAFNSMPQNHLIAIAVLITVGLFLFQPKGTDRVSAIFGPVMTVWFSALAVSGAVSVAEYPWIFKAVNPYYFIKFFINNGFTGFLILSEVILCATGAEALYADMGHLGKKPLIRAWYIVIFALILSYSGQAVFLLKHPDAKNLLFALIRSESLILYIPFLVLTVLSTIIASQALISGVFSIVYQGITTRIFPRIKVDFTSYKLKSQIYIGPVNWIMMIAVIFIILLFKKSENLAAAYGLAVTGTMSITGIMMVMIYYIRNNKISCFTAMIVLFINFLFLAATLSKLPHGAYWSLIIASVPLSIIIIWREGQKQLFRKLRPVDLDTFLISYKQIYTEGRRIAGTGLFFVGSHRIISPYVAHCIISGNIIYENNVLITVIITEDPLGITASYTSDIGPGLHLFEIRAGYKEEINITSEIAKAGIIPKVIFYGTEDISTNNIFWKIYALIKKLTPSFVQFYRLPVSKLHGIITRVEM